MPTKNPDTRSPDRKLNDEQIAAAPELAPLHLSADAQPASMEQHLGRLRPRPQAFVGIVEKGVIRPLDADVHLPEHSKVIIVASAES